MTVYKCLVAVYTVCLLLLSIAVQANQGVEKQEVDGETLFDPTRPTNWRASPTPARRVVEKHFELGYTVVSAQRKRAYLNGKSVREGDYVDGAKVVRIEDNRVRLLVNGRQRDVVRKKPAITKIVR